MDQSLTMGHPVTVLNSSHSWYNVSVPILTIFRFSEKYDLMRPILQNLQIHLPIVKVDEAIESEALDGSVDKIPMTYYNQ